MIRTVPYFGLLLSCSAGLLAEVYTRRLIGIDLFSFSWWLILPIGAIILGLISGVGFSVGSYVTHHKPQWYDAAVIATLLILTIAATQYVDYSTFVLPNGQKASDLADFETFFRLSTETAHLRVGRTLHADAGEVGWFGYILFAVEVAAFLIAGISNYAIILGFPACHTCPTYLRKIKTRSTPPLSVRWCQGLLHLCSGDFPSLQRALSDRTLEKSPDNENANMSIIYRLYECPHCKRESLIITPRQITRNGWNELQKASIRRDMSVGTTLFSEMK